MVYVAMLMRIVLILAFADLVSVKGETCDTLDVQESGGSWAHEGSYLLRSSSCHQRPVWSQEEQGSDTEYYIYRVSGANTDYWMLGSEICDTDGIGRFSSDHDNPNGTWEAVSPSGDWGLGYTMSVSCVSIGAGPFEENRDTGESGSDSGGALCSSLELDYPGHFSHEGDYSSLDFECSCCADRKAYFSSETSYYIYYDRRYTTWYISSSLCGSHAVSRWPTSASSPVGSWPGGETVRCKGLTTIEIIGIVVGVVIGIIIIVVIVCCCCAVFGSKNSAEPQRIFVRPAMRGQVMPMTSSNGQTVVTHAAPPPYSLFESPYQHHPGRVQQAGRPVNLQTIRVAEVPLPGAPAPGPAPPPPGGNWGARVQFGRPAGPSGPFLTRQPAGGHVRQSLGDVGLSRLPSTSDEDNKEGPSSNND